MTKMKNYLKFKKKKKQTIPDITAMIIFTKQETASYSRGSASILIAIPINSCNTRARLNVGRR